MRPLKVFNEFLDSADNVPPEFVDDDEVEAEPYEESIAKETVVKKYKRAAKVVNQAMDQIVKKCEPGAKVLELCELGDKMAIEETGKAIKKDKNMQKGVSFPTCISINNCACHFSPIRSDPAVELKLGDMVKVDLGAHIDGYCSVAGCTHVVGASQKTPVTGKKADVVLAAYYAAEAALRVMKPGAENFDVTEIITRVANEFGCRPLSGMLCHQLKRNVIDGNRTIVLNPDEDQRQEQARFAFEMYEIYGLDVMVSSGEGKVKEMDARTTVFKKRPNALYSLKLKTSRQFFTEVEKRFGDMAFNLRMCNDEKKARLGVVECVKHGLIDNFLVLCEKANEFIAQFKFTVLILPDCVLKINSLPFNPECYKSKFSVKDPELVKLLSQSMSLSDAQRQKDEMEKKAWEDVARALDIL